MKNLMRIVAITLVLHPLWVIADDSGERLNSYLACQSKGKMVGMICLVDLRKWAFDSPSRYSNFLDEVEEKLDTHTEEMLNLLIALQMGRKKILPASAREAYPKVEERFDFIPLPVETFLQRGWLSLMGFESADLAVSGGTWIASYVALKQSMKNAKAWKFKKFLRFNPYVFFGSMFLAVGLIPVVDDTKDGFIRNYLESEWEEELLQLEQERDLRKRLAILKKITEDALDLAIFMESEGDKDPIQWIHQVITGLERQQIDGAEVYLKNLHRYIHIREMLIKSTSHYQ